MSATASDTSSSPLPANPVKPTKQRKGGAHSRHHSIDDHKPGKSDSLNQFADLEWVAREKIHGAKLCLSYRGTQFSTYLDRENENYDLPDAYTGKNSYLSMILVSRITAAEMWPIKELYAEAMMCLWELLGHQDFDVYCEIFGGAYPGHNGSTKAVRPEIFHSPTYHILAFDIKVAGEFLADDEMKALLDRVGIPVAPERSDSLHRPPVFKIKGDRFKETVFEQTKKKKHPPQNPSPFQELLDEARAAANNEHRYWSLMARLSEDERADKEAVASVISEDVLKHLEEVQSELLVVCSRDKGERKEFNKRLLTACRRVVAKMSARPASVLEQTEETAEAKPIHDDETRARTNTAL
jgi:hypothetical protein